MFWLLCYTRLSDPPIHARCAAPMAQTLLGRDLPILETPSSQHLPTGKKCSCLNHTNILQPDYSSAVAEQMTEGPWTLRAMSVGVRMRP